MTSGDFENIIRRFQQRPIPGRKVYVWYAFKAKLLEYLPANITQEMDLVKIVSEDIESDADEIRKKMKRAIASELDKLISQLIGQQILLVSNTYLLARYKVSLNVFYANYLSDRTMIVFLIPKEKVEAKLPGYVTFTQDATLKYFQKLFPDEHRDNIIKEGE